MGWEEMVDRGEWEGRIWRLEREWDGGLWDLGTI
jgi:hypothetical protein